MLVYFGALRAENKHCVWYGLALALAPDDGMSAVTFGTARFCTTSDLERLDGCTMTFGTARPLGIAAPVRDASLVWDASPPHSLRGGAHGGETGLVAHGQGRLEPEAQEALAHSRRRPAPAPAPARVATSAHKNLKDSEPLISHMPTPQTPTKARTPARR